MKRTPREIEDSARQVTRRGLLMAGLMGSVSVVLAGRLHHLQVTRASDFRLLAEENRIADRLIPPERGLIYDRNGIVLAENEQNYRITLVPEDAEDIDGTLEHLAELIMLDPSRLDSIRREISRAVRAGEAFLPVTIADRVTWEELSAVAVNAPALPGVTPEFGLSRVYPLGADFAHVVGYVRRVPEDYREDTGDTDPVLRIPDFQVGLLNIEEGMERNLRGRAGIRRVEVNASGRIMRELSREEAQPGAELQLSIDAGLQNYTEARLNGQSAGAVVMDVNTGEVLTLASAPSFDPNLFVRGFSSATFSEWIENPYRPLANKATQGLYPPGSTYKMIVALAALEGGHVSEDETVRCGGFTELGNRRFHCWRRGGHGAVDMIEALSQSCDVYFYELAQRVGIEAISAMARRLGCGVRHDLPLSAVATGLAPTMAWKRQNRGADWLVGDTLNASIGQGFVLNSPLQLAVMTARIATGRAVSPRVVKSVDGVDQTPAPAEPLGLNPANLELVRAGMYRAVNNDRGTAFGSRVLESRVGLSGKTGTSQVRNISVAEREAGVTANEDLPWEERDHALFVGYAPIETPRYAVSVVVEHGGGGAAVAAPIARDILLRAQLGTIPPSELYPAGQRRGIEAMHDTLPLIDLPGPTGPSRGGSSQA